MIETITAFYQQHEATLGIIATLSAILFIASILSLPYLVSLIPADYFLSAEPYREYHIFKHPVVRVLIIFIKNLVGWLLILAGIAMLLLPGQGLITMIIGLSLINFPGKRKTLCQLIRRKKVLRTLNWLRSLRNKEPLLVP